MLVLCRYSPGHLHSRHGRLHTGAGQARWRPTSAKSSLQPCRRLQASSARTTTTTTTSPAQPTGPGRRSKRSQLAYLRQRLREFEQERDASVALARVCGKRSQRLLNRIQGLTQYAAERVAAGDEAAARKTLQTKAQVQGTLAVTMARARNNQQLAAKLEEVIGYLQCELEELAAALADAGDRVGGSLSSFDSVSLSSLDDVQVSPGLQPPVPGALPAPAPQPQPLLLPPTASSVEGGVPSPPLQPRPLLLPPTTISVEAALSNVTASAAAAAAATAETAAAATAVTAEVAAAGAATAAQAAAAAVNSSEGWDDGGSGFGGDWVPGASAAVSDLLGGSGAELLKQEREQQQAEQRAEQADDAQQRDWQQGQQGRQQEGQGATDLDAGQLRDGSPGSSPARSCDASPAFSTANLSDAPTLTVEAPANGPSQSNPVDSQSSTGHKQSLSSDDHSTADSSDSPPGVQDPLSHSAAAEGVAGRQHAVATAKGSDASSADTSHCSAATQHSTGTQHSTASQHSGGSSAASQHSTASQHAAASQHSAAAVGWAELQQRLRRVLRAVRAPGAAPPAVHAELDLLLQALRSS